VETPEQVAARIRRALAFVPPERLVINPDCGLRHLPAEVARAKLRAMVAGTEQVRTELASQSHEPPAPPSQRQPSAGTGDGSGDGSGDGTGDRDDNGRTTGKRSGARAKQRA